MNSSNRRTILQNQLLFKLLLETRARARARVFTLLSPVIPIKRRTVRERQGCRERNASSALIEHANFIIPRDERERESEWGRGKGREEGRRRGPGDGLSFFFFVLLRRAPGAARNPIPRGK